MDVVRWMLATGGIRTSLKVDVGLVDAESFDADFECLSGGLGLVPIRPDEGCITLESVDSIYSECKRLLKETAGRQARTRSSRGRCVIQEGQTSGKLFFALVKILQRCPLSRKRDHLISAFLIHEGDVCP